MQKLKISVASVLWLLTSLCFAEVVCGAARNTIEETQCMSDEINKADKKLADYLQAAKARIERENEVQLRLNAAQDAWVQYRKVHCGDVYTYWSQGTTRYRQSAQCQIDLSRERTHDIWAAYLTFFGTTPPLLPEP